MTEPQKTETSDESPDLETLNRQQEMGLLAEFWLFIREEKLWWLTPIVVVLLLVGTLVALTQTGAAPFIYALF